MCRVYFAETTRQGYKAPSITHVSMSALGVEAFDTVLILISLLLHLRHLPKKAEVRFSQVATTLGFLCGLYGMITFLIISTTDLKGIRYHNTVVPLTCQNGELQREDSQAMEGSYEEMSYISNIQYGELYEYTDDKEDMLKFEVYVQTVDSTLCDTSCCTALMKQQQQQGSTFNCRVSSSASSGCCSVSCDLQIFLEDNSWSAYYDSMY